MVAVLIDVEEATGLVCETISANEVITSPPLAIRNAMSGRVVGEEQAISLPQSSAEIGVVVAEHTSALISALAGK